MDGNLLSEINSARAKGDRLRHFERRSLVSKIVEQLADFRDDELCNELFGDATPLDRLIVGTRVTIHEIGDMPVQEFDRILEEYAKLLATIGDLIKAYFGSISIH